MNSSNTRIHEGLIRQKYDPSEQIQTHHFHNHDEESKYVLKLSTYANNQFRQNLTHNDVVMKPVITELLQIRIYHPSLFLPEFEVNNLNFFVSTWRWTTKTLHVYD